MRRKIKLKAKMTPKRSILSESDVIQKIRQELHEDDPGRALFHLIQSDQPEARKAIMFDYINKNSEGQIIKGFVKELEMFKFSNVGRAHMKIVDVGSDRDDLSVEFVSISSLDEKPSEDILETIHKTVGAFLEKSLYPFGVVLDREGWNSSLSHYKVVYEFYYDITQKSHREAYKAFESVYKCCEAFDDVCGTVEEIILNETFPERKIQEGIEDRGEEAIQKDLDLKVFKKNQNTHFELKQGNETLFTITTRSPMPYGKSLGAQHIVKTKAKKGWGGLGYEMAMAYHHPKDKKSYALMPDSTVVSPSAEKVWKKYSERSDVEHHSLDDVDAWDEMDKRTPDYPYDDSYILEPSDFENDYREDNHYLDRAYRLTDSRAEQIKNLMRELGVDV
mgnify:CR=1 FL=1